MNKRGDLLADLGWKEWAAIAGGVVVCLFVAVKLSPEFGEILFSSNTASWVQGLGVLLAIVVSVVSQRTSERQKRLDRIETIRMVVAHCASSMRMVRLQCDDGEGIARAQASGGAEEIRLTSEMLSALDVYDFPNTLSLKLFLMLRNNVRQLSERLRGAAATQWHSPEGAAMRRRLADEARDAETCALALGNSLVFGGKPVVDADREN